MSICRRPLTLTVLGANSGMLRAFRIPISRRRISMPTGTCAQAASVARGCACAPQVGGIRATVLDDVLGGGSALRASGRHRGRGAVPVAVDAGQDDRLAGPAARGGGRRHVGPRRRSFSRLFREEGNWLEHHSRHDFGRDRPRVREQERLRGRGACGGLGESGSERDLLWREDGDINAPLGADPKTGALHYRQVRIFHRPITDLTTL